MKKKPAGKILSLILSAAMALGMFAAPPMTAQAAMPTSAAGDAWDGVDFAALMASGSGIYYGVFDHSDGVNTTGTKEPILWRIMGAQVAKYELGTGPNGRSGIAGGPNPEQIVLYSEYLLTQKRFDPDSYIWSNSELQTWLNGDFYDNSFLAPEKSAITETKNLETMDNNNANPRYSNDYIYIPGYYAHEDYKKELRNYLSTDLQCIAQYKGGSDGSWWLRSPYSFGSDLALFVTPDGVVFSDRVYYALGVRPAFKLNPESVIFTSEIVSPGGDGMGTIDAANGYSDAAEGGVAKKYKLTVVSSGPTLGGLSDTLGMLTSGTSVVSVTSGGSLALTGSVGGTGEKMAYKIVDRSSGSIVGYGQGSDTSNLTVSSAGLTVGGSYTLYVWAQKDNLINSHEGSTPQYFAMTVVSDAALVTAMSGLTSPIIGAVAANAATITSSEANGKTTANLTATVSTNAAVTYWSDAACIATELTGTGVTAFPLSVGPNTAYIKVVSESGTVTNIYTVTVTRAAAAPPSTGGGSSTPSYTVSFNTNGGGTISGKSVTSGGKVTKPADPAKEGYTFGGWYADAECTQKYDFEAKVTKALTLYAKWALPFKDVTESAWYYGAVADMYGRGLMLGTAEDMFSPDATLTRAMIVTILYRSAGEPNVSGLNNPFDDVAEGQWYSDAIKWAAANGIVEGYGNGKFGINDPVTKEQLVALLYRTQQADDRTPANAGGAVIPDADKVSDWAKAAVDALNAQGIFDDIPGAEFNPQAPATRAEVASMLRRFLEAAK